MQRLKILLRVGAGITERGGTIKRQTAAVLHLLLEQNRGGERRVLNYHLILPGRSNSAPPTAPSGADSRGLVRYTLRRPLLRRLPPRETKPHSGWFSHATAGIRDVCIRQSSSTVYIRVRISVGVDFRRRRSRNARRWLLYSSSSDDADYAGS